jgi:hypothetical protein
VQQSLEPSLLANPDDRGAHAADADYLTEQGDLSREFIPCRFPSKALHVSVTPVSDSVAGVVEAMANRRMADDDPDRYDTFTE